MADDMVDLSELLPGDGLSATIILPDAPVGCSAVAVRTWFDDVVDAIEPVMDGSLAAERDAATAFQRMAKAENARIAYRAAVRAWCAWCDHRGLPPLPAFGADVATFLASRISRKQISGRLEGTQSFLLDHLP